MNKPSIPDPTFHMTSNDFHTLLAIPRNGNGSVQPIGHHDYDIIVGLLTRFRPSQVVPEIAKIYPADYASAAELLDWCDFHILYYTAQYELARLANPRFDAIDAMIGILEDPDAADNVAKQPIAKALNSLKELDAVQKTLTHMDPDVGKSVWSSLAFAQNANMAEIDFRSEKWWLPDYMKRYSVF